MSLHTEFIPAARLRPDSSGNVFPVGAALKMVNDLFDFDLLLFKNVATISRAGGLWRVPKNFVSAPKFTLLWSSSQTAGNCRWEFRYKAIAIGETLDPGAVDQTMTVEDAAPPAARDLLGQDFLPTAGNFVVGDFVPFSIGRDTNSVLDTIESDEVWLAAVMIEYSDA